MEKGGKMIEPIYDLEADAEWIGAGEPNDWRELPEPDSSDLDDDEDEETPQYLIDVLGFDPDDLFDDDDDDDDITDTVDAATAVFERAAKDCGANAKGGHGFQPGNTCAADDGPSSDHNTISIVPYSQQKLESAIDQWVVSNGGTPELKWTREKGFQELPPLETMDALAAEQQSYSGKPISTEAKQSYDALKKALYSQFEAIQKSGLKVYAWQGEGEPYKESDDKPWSPNSNIMRQRVEEEKKFFFFMTQSGFGAEGSGESTKHPLLEMSPFKTEDGKPMLANDVFRVVHDAVGHLYGKFSFSTRGEMNAMLSHASTLPKEAHAALFAETFGQNAVYEKTGKYADQNTYVSEFLPEIERMLKSKTGSAAMSKSYSPEISDGPDSDYPLGFGHIKRRPTGWDDAQVTGDDIASTIFMRAASGCGANAKGGHGFQPGNTCGANGGFLNDAEIDKQSAKSVSFSGMSPDDQDILSREVAQALEADQKTVKGYLTDRRFPLINADVSTLSTQALSAHSPDMEKVASLRKFLEANPTKDLPPILVRHGSFLEGGHRVKAYKDAGRTSIPALEVSSAWGLPDNPMGKSKDGGSFVSPERQTETKAFKKWFGDSKVVDKDGNPLVVHHGTPNGRFSEFSMGAGSETGGIFGQGFYFTTSEQEAKSFTQGNAEGEVKSVYLKIEKPFSISEPIDKQIYPDIIQAVETYHKKYPTMEVYGEKMKREKETKVSELVESLKTGNATSGYDLRLDLERIWGDYVANKIIENVGFDGTKVKASDGVDWWIVFKSKQIKSATGNAGTFDQNDANITKSFQDSRTALFTRAAKDCGANAKGGHGFQPGNTCGADEAGGSVTSERQTDTKAFKKWFGNSKIVNEDGTPRVVYHGTGAEFDEFARSGARLTSIGTGYYFSPDPEVASAYAVGDNPHVKPVYLRAENMLDWESLSDSDRSKITEHLQSVVPAERLAGFGTIVKREFPRDADNEAEEFYKKKKEETKHLYHDRSKARVDFDKEKTVISWMEPGLASATDSNLKSLAQEYDQEIAKRLGYDSARNGNEIVVFDRKQIKSATGNSGAYSLDDAGISKSFQTTAQAFFARDWDETKYVRHGKGDERGGEFAPKGGGDSTDDKIIQKVVQHLYDYDNGERDAYDKATALMPEEPSDELRKGVETALADKHLEAKGGKDAVMKQLVELRTNELIALYNDDNQAEIKAKDEAHNITKNVYAAKDFGGKWIGEHVHEAVMQHIKDNHETVSDDLVNGLLKSSLNRNDRTYLFDKPGMSDVLNIVQDRAEERAKDAGVDIDTLFTQRSEFTELPRPEDDDGTWFKKISALTDEWDSNAKRAVSLGVISPEVAMAHGFYPTGGEVYKHMPEELYTVTTAVDAVMNSKLKTRDELGQRNGAGLGGGSSDTISFTHDPEIAVQIKESIREAGRVARGEITRQQMVDAADKNLDIRTGKELYGTFKDQFRYVFSRGELEDKLSDTKRDGTPKTEEEIRYDAFDVYKKYAFIRENHGGPIDPLFFSADLDAIARMPLEQVQIIKAKMKPTSRGYQVSALGEWRVHTGDTVSDMSVMNDDRDENSSKSAALAKSLGCLYMFRDSSRQTAVNVAQAIFTRSASGCGANAKGGHGFQPGNTCGADEAGGSVTSERQTDTKEFKQWFGASKVMDENGEPKVVYHGSPSGGFTEFVDDKSGDSSLYTKQGPGFYFTDHKKSANQYTKTKDVSGKWKSSSEGELYEVFLRIENPLVINKRSSAITRDMAVAMFSEGDNDYFFDQWIPFSVDGVSVNGVKRGTSQIEAMDKADKVNLFVDSIFRGRDEKDGEILENVTRAYRNKTLMLESMRSATGKDGVEFSDEFGKIYVAWSPYQIKSATRNRGTFDPHDANITKSFSDIASIMFTRASSCGANADGGGGFQPGNSCGGESGSGGGSSTSTGDKKGTGRKLREAFYGTKKDHAEVLAKADEKHIAKNEEDPETARAVKETFTTPEQKKQYTKVIKDTLDKLPPMMSDVIARNVKDIKFCSKVEEVGYLANKAKPPKGVYGFFRPGSGELVLNGGPKSDEQNPEAKALTQHGIYAHEMAHAADRIGNGNTFSASKSWAEAYAHEINRDDVPLSNYARQNAQEGFAEFVRLMATNPELTKQKYPKCAKAVQSVYGRF